MQYDIPQENLSWVKPTVKEPTAPYIRFVVLTANVGDKNVLGVLGLGMVMVVLLANMAICWLKKDEKSVSLG